MSNVLSVGFSLHLLLPLYSAGVGRTGTYIAIDAMLESAEKIKTVFIQNYVQVMRRSRPHMIQKDVSLSFFCIFNLLHLNIGSMKTRN